MQNRAVAIWRNSMARGPAWTSAMFAVLVFAVLASTPAFAHDTVYYYYTTPLHNVAVETDAHGNVIERTYYAPYGQVLNRPMRDGPGFTGEEEDPATGLVYMQQRYYDPQAGRFISTDPVGVSTATGLNFNRYWYGKDNPYRYNDPFGTCSGAGTCSLMVQNYAAYANAHPSTKLPTLEKIGLGVMLTATGVDEAAGAVGAARVAVRYVGAKIAGAVTRRAETETVQRAMSRGELQSVKESGELSRGGRSGPFHVSDSVNSDANRARQRLALPQTPEVRATLKVSKGVFSKASEVEPANGMPGGGMERTAPGNKAIPVKVIRVDKLHQ